MDFSSSHADATHFYLKRHCYFFTEFGVAFLSAGATSHRICQAIDRMKTVYGIEVECSVFPSRILITVWDAEENRSYSSVGHPRTLGVNLRISDELDRLSRNVVSEGIEVACAEKMLREIISTRRLASWKVTPLVGLANASFCRLFGGDPVSMLIVFAATVEGFALKTWLVSHRFDARISTFLSAFLAALFATSGYVFGWGGTPHLALGTSVLFLVPGIPYINSLTDILTGHSLNGVSRLIEAVVTTVCLSLGLCTAMVLAQISYQ